MGLSRAELATELWGWLQRSFVEVGITNSDTSGNLKEPLDATLSVFDVAYSDLMSGAISDGAERRAINVAVYYGYAAILVAAETRVTSSISVSAPSVSKSVNWSDYVQNITKAMERARAIAAPDLPSDATWGSGSMSLGFVSGGRYDEFAIEDAS
jgi:hypothetical protein